MRRHRLYFISLDFRRHIGTSLNLMRIRFPTIHNLKEVVLLILVYGTIAAKKWRRSVPNIIVIVYLVRTYLLYSLNHVLALYSHITVAGLNELIRTLLIFFTKEVVDLSNFIHMYKYTVNHRQDLQEKFCKAEQDCFRALGIDLDRGFKQEFANLELKESKYMLHNEMMVFLVTM